MTRLPAEWETQSAVQLTLPHPNTDWGEVLDQIIPVFESIANEIAKREQVLLVCRDEQEAREWMPGLAGDRIRFFEIPSNDTWARDHAGISVFEHEHKVILDFEFNGWGLKFPADLDNRITEKLFNHGVFQAERKVPGLVLEGGAIESDGQGTLLTTSECMLSPNRNPHLKKEEIEAKLCDLFGLQQVLWLDHGYLAGDDTDSHIDTLARFCNAHTIAYVQCSDRDDEHFSSLNAMEKQLQGFRQLNGANYELVPLPMPDACYAEDGHRLPATYANFLIINGAVLVPVYGVSQDEEALRVLKRLFPDRDILPINCRGLIEQHGSLHCLTMQYPEGWVS